MKREREWESALTRTRSTLDWPKCSTRTQPWAIPGTVCCRPRAPGLLSHSSKNLYKIPSSCLPLFFMTCQMHKAKLQNPIIHKPNSFPKKQYHNLTIKKEKIGRKKGSRATLARTRRRDRACAADSPATWVYRLRLHVLYTHIYICIYLSFFMILYHFWSEMSSEKQDTAGIWSPTLNEQFLTYRFCYQPVVYCFVCLVVTEASVLGMSINTCHPLQTRQPFFNKQPQIVRDGKGQ